MTDAGGPAARAIGGGEALTEDQIRSAALRSIPRPSRLARPLGSLQGAGPKLAAAAAEFGIETVGDLLAHVPREHRDHGEVVGLGDLRIGEQATVLVEVRSARKRPTRRRNLAIVEADVADVTGRAKAIWFNQAYLVTRLTPGTRLLLTGKLERGTFKVASHELVSGEGAGIHTVGVVPVHAASDRLRLSAQRIREWAKQAVELAPEVIEPLPAGLRARRRLATAADSISEAHFPADLERAAAARRRLAYEELFLHQAALAQRRGARGEGRRAPALQSGAGSPKSGVRLPERWVRTLPFGLTDDQRRAIEEIDADLVRERPMQRLLMGEVGSGKTVVALNTMLRAVAAGSQAALMAPTETLAEQHHLTLERLLGDLVDDEGVPVSFALLTGSIGAARRREILGHLASGQLRLVVGTHALIEPDVRFARLGVAVVDEQHRFGVRQRAALDSKGFEGLAPHTLHMTATPIPRTLSLTAYGDLDATVLRELPAGRKPVQTWSVGEAKRPGAYEFLRERLREGRQAYVVCPLVSESESLQARAATEEAEELRRGELRDFEVGCLHGQMRPAEKAAAMERFASGRTDVLVATSVIEVGIDVPNATVMIVESAERYGLSQLHQLRGRVGRGEHESFCILFGSPESETARARLEAIANERDGFRLAEIDLSLRGEGEILGTRQHGLPRFRVAELPDDAELLELARSDLLDLMTRYERLDDPALGPLLDVARERFGDERSESFPA